jgi:GTP-binding protein HflX
LVEAFRSTLDDVKDSDVLLHVVDASDPDPQGQIEAVHDVLEEIGARAIPEYLLFNKIDLVDPVMLGRLRNIHPDALFISAETGEGIDSLLASLGEVFEIDRKLVRLQIPYERGDVLAAAHRLGEVVAEKHDDTFALLEVRLPLASFDQFEEYVAG